MYASSSLIIFSPLCFVWHLISNVADPVGIVIISYIQCTYIYIYIYIYNTPTWVVQFCLVFWDVIFAPVPGAFETSFQTAPLDMATDAFRIGKWIPPICLRTRRRKNEN
ncbi:hypothetical protein VP01_820g1 [Puccinia sorghi]|uniref:Fanconi-associated nuclease n=1 Tax=Puccinia sorghi TaxID=27349 RepID=A0A0L6UAT0_9BASI|nr:hypothetical protein VP01_820g1 [Puccinia sorghi]